MQGFSTYVASAFILLHVTLQGCEVRGAMTKPCKFGDKIEYGKLGKEVLLSGNLDAYVAHPNNAESKGGVIVIQDIYGWTLSNTRAIVDMLMDNNFTAILPDAFEGKPAWNRSAGFRNFGSFMAERPPSGIGRVINASIEYLRDELDVTRVAMVGFCWGGRAVHYAMANREDLVAGVSCYGLMGSDEERFGQLNDPTLFIFGGADRAYTSKDVRTLRQALNDNASARFAIRRYKGQPHGFVHRKLASPDDPNKDQIYAARKKMIKWLNRYLAK